MTFKVMEKLARRERIQLKRINQAIKLLELAGDSGSLHDAAARHVRSIQLLLYDMKSYQERMLSTRRGTE